MLVNLYIGDCFVKPPTSLHIGHCITFSCFGGFLTANSMAFRCREFFKAAITRRNHRRDNLCNRSCDRYSFYTIVALSVCKFKPIIV